MTVQSGRAAAAGQAISLTTSPVTLNLVIKPGTSETKELQLKNNSRQAVTIDMKVQIFGPSGTEGHAAITEPKPGDESTKWVHFSPAHFVAQPGVTNKVKMTIDMPASASLGYYYAVIFQPAIDAKAAPGTSTIKGSNAILVLVDTKAGDQKRQVQVSDFSVDKKVYEYLPAKFSVRVHNGGNIYLAPTGNIFISRHKDITHTLATLDVNNGSANVLPRSDRIFTVKWTDGFPAFKDKLENGQPVLDKKGNPVQQLVWNTSASISKIRFGKYYAQLTLVYNNGNRVVPVTGVVSFWVIPWKLILLLVFGLILLAVVRRMLKKLVRKAWRKLHNKPAD